MRRSTPWNIEKVWKGIKPIKKWNAVVDGVVEDHDMLEEATKVVIQQVSTKSYGYPRY